VNADLTSISIKDLNTVSMYKDIVIVEGTESLQVGAFIFILYFSIFSLILIGIRGSSEFRYFFSELRCEKLFVTNAFHNLTILNYIILFCNRILEMKNEKKSINYIK